MLMKPIQKKRRIPDKEPVSMKENKEPTSRCEPLVSFKGLENKLAC